MGSLIRVIPGVFKDLPTDLESLVAKETNFWIFFPVRAALSRGIVRKIGSHAIPDHSKSIPVFRAGVVDPAVGKVADWWLWDGEREWRVGSITDEQQKLPIRGSWNDTILIRRSRKVGYLKTIRGKSILLIAEHELFFFQRFFEKRGWMGNLRNTKASLQIIGDDLNPNEITRLLCCTPTDSQSKGDERVGKRSGHTHIAGFGSWSLKAPEQQPGDLDAQINWLMAAVTNDLDTWQSIAARYRIRLFCGLFMDQWNDGESISAASLLALGARHIQMDLDIYGAADEYSN